MTLNKLSNNKIPFISFRSKYTVIPSTAETIAVADDVWEEVVKHVLLTIDAACCYRCCM